jgi:hypothetical protein
VPNPPNATQERIKLLEKYTQRNEGLCSVIINNFTIRWSVLQELADEAQFPPAVIKMITQYDTEESTTLADSIERAVERAKYYAIYIMI